ncbi:MAG: c(7)-type cytochrome triheme domain-containing protein [Gammaproteobacteria bacterium]
MNKQAVVMTLMVWMAACQPGSGSSVQTPRASPAPESAVTTVPNPASTPPSAADQIAAQTDAIAVARTSESQRQRPPAKSTGVRKSPTRASEAFEGMNQFYDRSNPLYGKLQKANESMTGFPTDRMGRVDWIAALRKGIINPRADIKGAGHMQVLGSEVIMTHTREMPYVRFPHATHTEWLACKNCHDGIFKAKKGANPMTMTDIFRGRYCGQCHDRVAFSTFICERCHSIAQSDARTSGQ